MSSTEILPTELSTRGASSLDELDVTDVSKDLDLSSLEKELDPEAITKEVELPRRSLPELGDISDVTDITRDLDLSKLEKELDVESVTKEVPSKRLLGLDDLLDTVNGLLTDVLNEVDGLEKTLTDLLADLEAANAAAVLETVEAEVTDLLNKVQDIAKEAGVDLDLSELNPTLAIVSNEIDAVVKLVDQLIEEGELADEVDQIKKVLAEVVAIVEGIKL